MYSSVLRYDRFFETRERLYVRTLEWNRAEFFCDRNVIIWARHDDEREGGRIQPRIRASQWSRPNCSRAKARWNSTTFHSEAEAARFEWSYPPIGRIHSDVTALIVPRTPHHVAHRTSLSPFLPLSLSLAPFHLPFFLQPRNFFLIPLILLSLSLSPSLSLLFPLGRKLLRRGLLRLGWDARDSSSNLPYVWPNA